MLCNFSTSSNIIAPAAKITLIINTDLTWNVLVGHRHIKETIAIPDKLRNSGDFIYLFNLFDTCLFVLGYVIVSWLNWLQLQTVKVVLKITMEISRQNFVMVQSDQSTVLVAVQ